MSTDQSPKPTIDPASNLKPLISEISTAYADINDHKKARGEANAEIAAILTGLEAKGIGKRAMRMAMTYVEFSEDEKSGFDLAYKVVRDALGEPLQAKLFDGS